MTVLSKAEFELILADIERRTEQMQHEGQRLIATTRQWRIAFGPFGYQLDELLISIDRQLAAAQSTIAKFMPRPGVPWTLWHHGMDWSGPEIGGRISAQVGKVTLAQLRVDDYWTGSAANAYKDSIAPQKEALTTIAGFTRDIHSVLSNMAVGLGAFWLAVLAAIIDLLLSLTAGTAVASTGVGAPPAAAGCVAALVKFVGFLVAIVTAFTAFVMWAAAPGIKDLWQNLNNNTAFPGGHWPGADLPGGWQIGRA